MPGGLRTWVAIATMLAIVATSDPAGAIFGSGRSITANAVATDTLDPPTAVTAVAIPGAIEVSWSPAPDLYATGHQVLRSATPGGPYTLVAQLTPRTASTDTDIPPSGGTWYYVVRSFYQNWTSVNSAEVSAAPGSNEDFDAVAPGVDNCPSVFNIDQFDTDGDGTGDACDASPTLPSGGVFTANGQVAVTGYAEGLKLGDLDGDGDIDAVFADWAAPNSVWLNNGSGVLANSGQALGNSQTTASGLADLDGDGDLDIVFTNNAQAHEIWLNNGSGQMTLAQSLGPGVAEARDVGIGDFDGDGDLDLVITYVGQADTVWFNNGSGSFTNTGQALGNADGWDVGVGDLDGDADLDLWVGNDNGGADTAWFNDGTGTFVNSGQALGTFNSTTVALGDIDGDGDLDAAVGAGNQANRIWRNNGSGAFTNTGQAHGSADTRDNVLGDFDGDGDLDLSYSDVLTADSVWRNNGTGTFTNTGQVLGLTGWSAAAADMDGDGDLDLVFSERNTVWRNN